jgi:hypothetical protein
MGWTAPATWTVGELVLASKLNTHVRDNMLAVGPHLIVRKTADESVTSSTTLQNDDHLVFTGGVNEVWQVGLTILYEGSATGDIKIAFTYPTGSGFKLALGASGVTNGPTAQNDAAVSDGASPSNSLVYFGIGAGLARVVNMLGVWAVGATGGNLQLQWAQNASDATATKVLTHSTLWAVKLA